MVQKRSFEKKKRQDGHVFEIEEDLCVWMTAKVVNFKLCDRTYDCLSCPFDKAMREAWDQDSHKESTWEKRLNSVQGADNKKRLDDV